MTKKSSGSERSAQEPAEHAASPQEPGTREPSTQQAAHDGAAFLRRSAETVRRVALSRPARNAWTGAVALAVTGGVLVSASASVPPSGSAIAGSTTGAQSTGAPASTARTAVRAGSSTTSARTEPTASDRITIGQVLAVLDRAERAQQRSKDSLSPVVAQASAELGMLYTTYRTQQLALADAATPLRVETAPTTGEPGPAPRSSAKHGEAADGRATQVSRAVFTRPQHPSVDQARTEVAADQKPAASVGSDPGYVTFDEVAVAAMRLANMLDPSSATATSLVETLPGSGSSLRRSLLDTVATHAGSTAGYTNGRIPAEVLCPLGFAPGHLLRCDAAERLTALSEEFEAEFGYPIPMTDSYRSYAMQEAVKGTKPHLAAIPGTSNHGWGLAVDLGDPIAGGSSPEYVWLRLHAPDYGWDNPSWAQLDGAKPEPWHFEFFAAGSIPNRAIDPADVGTWASVAPSRSADGDARPAASHRPASAEPGDTAGGAANGSDRAPQGSGDGAASKPDDQSPAAPAKPAPAKPAEPAPDKPTPTEPPAQEPAVDPVTGLVDGVVGGAVDLVGGTVDGVVGGLLGSGKESGEDAGKDTNED